MTRTYTGISLFAVVASQHSSAFQQQRSVEEKTTDCTKVCNFWKNDAWITESLDGDCKNQCFDSDCVDPCKDIWPNYKSNSLFIVQYLPCIVKCMEKIQ